jgi:hypothetical protein
VCGDDLEPDEISRLLGRAPTRSQRKGQPVLDESGRTKRIARTGSWLLDYALSPDATITEAIESLLEILPGDTQPWQTLGERFSVDLLCHIFVRGVNQGFVVAPRVLESLGRRGIELGLDIFCRSDPEQAAALADRLAEKTAK